MTPDFSENYRLNLTLKFMVTELYDDDLSEISSLSAEGVSGGDLQNSLLLGSKSQFQVDEGEAIFSWVIVPEDALYLVNFEIKAIGIGEWQISSIKVELSIFENKESPGNEPQNSGIKSSISILIISISLLYLLPVIKIIRSRRRHLKNSEGPIFRVKVHQER